MQQELQERRRTVWKRLVLEGDPERKVVTEVAEAHGVTEGTIRDDITSMDEWLPELYRSGEANDVSAMVELQENRHRLHQMAAEARDQGALDLELKIRKEISRTIDREQKLSDDVTLSADSGELDDLLDSMP